MLLRFLLPLLLALTLLPGNTAASDTVPSRLEADYSLRAGTQLRLFGHGLFAAHGPQAPAVAPPLGVVGDAHVLSLGDEITLTLRGQTSSTRTYRVDSTGNLMLDELRPIVAAGRTLGEVRAEIEVEVEAALLETRAFVTLSAVRRLSVLVLGEVAAPGRHELPAFATLVDALLAAGGIAPEGSLRRVRLADATGSVTVDLYDLLRDGDGGAADRPLRDGTRIVVPPIGATVAIAGAVKRPGIYELADAGGRLALAVLLDLAGGPLRPGPDRALRLSFDADGQERAEEVADPDLPLFGDGDILVHAPRRSDRGGVVRVEGAVRTPGLRALETAPSLADLLGVADLAADAWLPFAIVAGREGAIGDGVGARTLRAVALDRVLGGQDSVDWPLADGELVAVLGEAEVAFLSGGDVLDLLAGRRDRPVEGACGGLHALAASLAADPRGALAAGPLATAAAELVGPPLPCPDLFARHPDLLPFALAHAVLVRSGVLRPGLYPAAPGTAAEALVRAAGGGEAVGPGDTVGSGDTVGFRAGPRVVDAGLPAVELVGAVTLPGRRLLAEAGTLRQLLGDGEDVLSPAAYGLFAVLERFDAAGVARRLIPFAPVAVLAGESDRRLADRDRIHILSRAEVERLLAEEHGEAARPLADSAPLTRRPPVLETPEPPERDAAADDPPVADPEKLGDAELKRLLAERLVRLHGAVAAPGTYPLAEELALGRLLAAAGGPAFEADPRAVEIVPAPGAAAKAEGAGRVRLVDLTTGGDAERIRPGDGVRVAGRLRPSEPRTVSVLGEVAQPGRFDLLPGETLSSLLARAGGPTAAAYPAGAVFTRESARRAEEEGLRRAAEELDRGLALVLLQRDPPGAEKVELVRRLADDLRAARAVGRITVEADPAVLAARPELDIVLEPGDRILIPRRPLTVTVSGEVLSPASLQFVSGKPARTYLREAGGFSRYADRGRVFVLLPDGSALPLRGLRARHTVEAIPPGSTIVVPRDPTPFEFLPVAQSVATILGQLALSAVAIAAIGD